MGCCGCNLSASTVTACIFGIVQSIAMLSLNGFFLDIYFTKYTPTSNLTTAEWILHLVSCTTDDKRETIRVLLIVAAIVNSVWCISSIMALIGNMKNKAIFLRIWVGITIVVIITDLIFAIVVIVLTITDLQNYLELLLKLTGGVLDIDFIIGYLLLLFNFQRFGIIGFIVNIVLVVFTYRRAKEIVEMGQKNVFRQPGVLENMPNPNQPGLFQHGLAPNGISYNNSAYDNNDEPFSDYDAEQDHDYPPPLSNSQFRLQQPNSIKSFDIEPNDNFSYSPKLPERTPSMAKKIKPPIYQPTAFLGRGQLSPPSMNTNTGSYSKNPLYEESFPKSTSNGPEYEDRRQPRSTAPFRNDQPSYSKASKVVDRTPSMAEKLKPPIYQPTAFHGRREDLPPKSNTSSYSKNPLYEESRPKRTSNEPKYDDRRQPRSTAPFRNDQPTQRYYNDKEPTSPLDRRPEYNENGQPPAIKDNYRPTNNNNGIRRPDGKDYSRPTGNGNPRPTEDGNPKRGGDGYPRPSGDRYPTPDEVGYPRPGGDKYPRPNIDEHPSPGGERYPKYISDGNPKLDADRYPGNLRTGAVKYPRPGGDRQPRPGGDGYPKPSGDGNPRPSGDTYPRPGGDKYPRPGVDKYPRPGGDQIPRAITGANPRPSGDTYPKPPGEKYIKPVGDRHPRPGGDQIPRAIGNANPRPIGNPKPRPAENVNQTEPKEDYWSDNDDYKPAYRPVGDKNYKPVDKGNYRRPGDSAEGFSGFRRY